MNGRYDREKMNAFLHRHGCGPNPGELDLPVKPQYYENAFFWKSEEEILTLFYGGHYDCPKPIIQTNDQSILILALYVFLLREKHFSGFPGRIPLSELQRRLRFNPLVSLDGPIPGRYFACSGGDDGPWSVGYQDGETAIPLFSDLDWETALFYLECFVEVQPAFDELFALLQRETGLARSERGPLLAVYLCGCCGTQLYEEQTVRREYPPEGAGRFDFARVDSYVHHARRLRLDRGPYGEYYTCIERRTDGIYRLLHQFDERTNGISVAENLDPAPVLLAAVIFRSLFREYRYDEAVTEEQRLALRWDPRVSYLRKEPNKLYLVQEGKTIELGFLHGDEDMGLWTFAADSGFREPERTLFQYLEFFPEFDSQFQSMCRPGLFSPRDWRFAVETAMEGYF